MCSSYDRAERRRPSSRRGLGNGQTICGWGFGDHEPPEHATHDDLLVGERVVAVHVSEPSGVILSRCAAVPIRRLNRRIERSSARMLDLVRDHSGNEARSIFNCARPVDLFQSHAVVVLESKHIHGDGPGAIGIPTYVADPERDRLWLASVCGRERSDELQH